MGQYWIPVNLTKREFVHPHRLGAGLKLWEQIHTHPGGVLTAVMLLCVAEREPRGGGDFEVEGAEGVIGRWAGGRIAWVGDYAERGDLPARDKAETIYGRCRDKYEEEPADVGMPPDWWYTDITDLVRPVVEKIMCIRFTGEGWRGWTNVKET